MPLHSHRTAPVKQTSSGGGGIGGFFHKHFGLKPHAGEIARKFGQGAKETAYGLPTGAVIIGHAGIKAAEGHPHDLVQIGKTMGKQTAATARHPGRDPFGALMLALTIPTLAGGTASRTLAGARAVARGENALKAVATKPVYTAKLPATAMKVAGNREEILKRAIAAGIKTEGPKRQFVSTEELKKAIAAKDPGSKIELFRNPLLRGVQRADVKMRGNQLAPKLAEKREHRIKRMQPHATRTPSKAGKIAGAPMDVFRIGMYARPRTALQNTLQTGMMLGTQQPLGIFKSARDLRWLHKHDPETWKHLREVGGETGTKSYLHAGESVSDTKTARLSRAMAEISSKPENAMRPLSHLYEGRRRGVGREDIGKTLRSQSDLAHRIMRAGDKEVGDFGNIGSQSSNLRKAMIFYPMFKALAEYTARFPTEHSGASALTRQAGAMGSAKQKKELGNLPIWARYLIPAAGGAKSRNPGALYNFQPGIDIAAQAIEGFRPGGPKQNLLQELSPLYQMIAQGTTGREPSEGYPLKHLGAGAVAAALADFATGLGPVELAGAAAGHPRTSKTYGKPSFMDVVKQQALGSAIVARPTDKAMLEKQYKRQFGKKKSYRHKHRPKSQTGY